MHKMHALSRAFEKAFAHTATKETLMDLLECLGEEIECDRISIFEYESGSTLANTYEWAGKGVEKERSLLQHVPRSTFQTWREELEHSDYVIVNNIADLQETDPILAGFFLKQNVHSVIVSLLAFHATPLGAFVIENPAPEVIADTEVLLPGMRYILSSLVYSDHLVHRLERIGYTDSLTGTGNRISLQEYLEHLNPEEAIGVIYCDAISWDIEDDKPQRIRHDMMLLKTGEVLTNIFDDTVVFRVSTGEFLVLLPNILETSFVHRVNMLGNLFREHDLLVAIGSIWRDHAENGFDALIRHAHLAVYDERKHLEEVHSKRSHVNSGERLWNVSDQAGINLHRGDEFFRFADSYLSELFDVTVLTIVTDINYFRLYNDIFGRKAGNQFLETIASTMVKEAENNNGIAGYLGGDNFVLMIPVQKDTAEELKPYLSHLVEELKYTDGFAPALGAYLSKDRQESMITMYDRALSALSEIKGDYIEHYRFYDAEHFRIDRDNKLLLMDIKQALPKGELLFYLQPQVHERTGKIIGAEALVRWNHNGQLISPGLFIPELEKTGYIFAVDTYIWEEVCKWLRSLIDRGIKPLPCSVNVSRVDFYFTDIAAHFINLLKTYNLPPELLGIEITESAFTDNTESIMEAVTKLHEAGFRILMDDFGSGSSSLSMLHEMNLDVLKTDVRFMSKKDSDVRAISIVESVISMAHMIGMLVVTEGVETENQRDNLIALGDNYAQGFFFYRPMPVEQFEELLQDPEKVGVPPKKGDRIMTNHLRFREMIQDGMVSDTLLDNIIGPAAIIKESKGDIQLLQMNSQYTELTGISPEDESGMKDFVERLHHGQKSAIAGILRSANTRPLEGYSGHVSFLDDNEQVQLEMIARVFLLYSCDDHRLYLVTLQDLNSDPQ